MIQIPDNVRANSAVADQRVLVIEVGPEAWKDEREPRASAGEHVMVTKYAGAMVMGPKDGVQYRLVNANEIYCAVED